MCLDGCGGFCAYHMPAVPLRDLIMRLDSTTSGAA